MAKEKPITLKEAFDLGVFFNENGIREESAVGRYFKANTRRVLRLHQWAKNNIGDEICQTGMLLILQSSATSWREYAKRHWKRPAFRAWVVGNEAFQQEDRRIPSYTCKECGHFHPRKVDDGWHLSDAYREGLSFEEFEAKYPKFKWPSWPFGR